MNRRLALVPAALAAISVPCVAADATDAAAVQAVTVFGSGQSRQVSELHARDLEAEVPGTSPLTALSGLPGVNFQSADAFGAYEWSTKLSVRGFGQNQLGFTLDDVPLGDMSYRNHNGLHISRAIISEDLGGVVLSEGAGALETASTSNLGGTIQFRSRDPSATAGGRVEQTVGEDAMRRTYARLESGTLGAGTRVSLGLADQRADKWKGAGSQRQQQVDLKAVAEGASARGSVFVDWSSRQEVDYQDLSKSMIARLGDRWDNYYPDWQAALDSARGIWRRGETSVDDAYYAGSGLRTDVLAGATLDWGLSDDLSWKTTVYHHTDRGPSLWYTPYVASSAQVPVSLRTVEYHIDRNGALSALTLEAGRHEWSVGVWGEHNVFDQAMRFYSQADGPSSPYDAPSDPMQTRWDYRFRTTTLQFHLKDTARWPGGLRSELGFKSVSSRTGVATRAGDPKSGEITAARGFLPQGGLNWKLDDTQELFATIARNLRAFKGAAMEDSPFASTQAGIDATRGSLAPETSTTAELGWRWHDSALETSVTAYHVDFHNRLLAIQEGSAIAGNPPVLANVGRVRTQGVEAGASWAFASRWRAVGTASFNDSRYRDDFVDDGQVVAVAGRQVVDAPRWIASAKLAYEDGRFFGHLGANTIGRRWYTYLNDNGVDAYTLFELGAGVRGTGAGALKAWRVQLGVENLFDRHYVASIGTNGFVASDPQGNAQTLLAGAPRSAYLTLAADF